MTDIEKHIEDEWEARGGETPELIKMMVEERAKSDQYKIELQRLREENERLRKQFQDAIRNERA